MAQCENNPCTRPAEVEKVQGADFVMTSTSTQSKRKLKICVPCAEQDARMQNQQRAALNTLK